jgi:choline dehydrogenase
MLCGGAFGSPLILLRSGVGPADDLHALGIRVVADRPGVGSHLLDHPLLGTTLWPLRHDVATTGSFMPVVTRARSRHADTEIDLHLYVGHSFDADRGDWSFWMSISLMDARSQGRITLASPDPSTPPIIDHAYFSDEQDLDRMEDGFALALALVARDPIARLLAPAGEATLPWHGRDRREWIRETVGTTWHPSGTCRMGPVSEVGTVVDHLGRVHGTTGLRVGDASIFPGVIRANLHCTIVAVAEKLADALRTEPTG